MAHMNQVIKFPDMRPPSRGGPIKELPPLAQYRQTTPAAITASVALKTAPVERRRLLAWFGVAVALHAALFIAIWLSPPLRLKWSPSPDAWVQVVSLPPPAPETPVVEPVKPPKPALSKAGAHKAPPAGDSPREKAR
jgi:hypothetical protein